MTRLCKEGKVRNGELRGDPERKREGKWRLRARGSERRRGGCKEEKGRVLGRVEEERERVVGEGGEEEGRETRGAQRREQDGDGGGVL